MSRTLAVLSLCVVLLGGFLPVSPARAEEPAPETVVPFAARADLNFNVPGSGNTKYPSAAGLGDQIFIGLSAASSSTSNDRTLRVAQKADAADSFPDTFGLGNTRGQADFANLALAPNRFDGSVHAAWINQEERSVKYRRRDANGTWGPERTVLDDNTFRVFVDIAVASDGRIFVAWSEDGFPRYRTSNDNGQTWSGTRRASNGNLQIITRPKVAAGANGTAILTYSSADNGNIEVGIWNGQDFVFQTAADSGRDYFTNPWGAIGPTGTIFLAWREAAQGVYFTERQANGSWPVSRIARGPIIDTVPISVDQQGNLSIMWITTASGRSQMFFAFRPVGRNFETFVAADAGGAALFNASGSSTLSNRGYGHGAAEVFSGGLQTRYFRFSADATNCEAALTFPNNGLYNTPSVTGTIGAPSGCQADRRQISLNTQNANAPVESLTPNTFSLTVPTDQLGQCTHTVNARLLQGSSAFGWVSRTVRVDPSTAQDPVQVRVELLNPALSSELSRATTPYDTVQDGGSRDGDRRFSRTLQAHVRVQDAGDCSGVAAFSGMNGQFTNVVVPAGGFNEVRGLGLPANAAPGRKEFSFAVADRAGNIEANTAAIIYDPADVLDPNQPNQPAAVGAGRPVLQPLAAQAADNRAVPDNSEAAQLGIIRTLSFQNVQVTDNMYNAANGVNVPANGQFWGVWVASEYLGRAGTPPAANPDSANLRYVPIRATNVTCTDAAGCQFSVRVNLFNGLRNADGTPFGPDTTKDGTYRVYVRFLDGAGNFTTAALTANFTLAPGYRLPSAILGVVAR